MLCFNKYDHRLILLKVNFLLYFLYFLQFFVPSFRGINVGLILCKNIVDKVDNFVVNYKKPWNSGVSAVDKLKVSTLTLSIFFLIFLLVKSFFVKDAQKNKNQ